jgi:hypothetical protein
MYLVTTHIGHVQHLVTQCPYLVTLLNVSGHYTYRSCAAPCDTIPCYLFLNFTSPAELKFSVCQGNELLSQVCVKMWFVGCTNLQNSSNNIKVPFILKCSRKKNKWECRHAISFTQCNWFALHIIIFTRYLVLQINPWNIKIH